MPSPERKLPRLTGFDYANEGYYFITICTHNKAPLFGSINSINEIGLIAENELLNIPNHFADVRIDKYVIMPNHIHSIVVIGCHETAERSRPFPTLSTVVGLYKSGVSKKVRKIFPEMPIWQKSFHDHIIRNDASYAKIWKYIDENPQRWAEDCYYTCRK